MLPAALCQGVCRRVGIWVKVSVFHHDKERKNSKVVRYAHCFFCSCKNTIIFYTNKILTRFFMKTKILESISRVVSDVCEVSVEDLCSHCKRAELVDARCIFVHFCKVYGFSNDSIMQFLKRTRACVIDNYNANFYIYSKQSFMFRVFSTQVAKKLAEIFQETK